MVRLNQFRENEVAVPPRLDAESVYRIEYIRESGQAVI